MKKKDIVELSMININLYVFIFIFYIFGLLMDWVINGILYIFFISYIYININIKI